MPHRFSSVAGVLVFVGCLATAAVADDWPHWRGPLDTGYAPEADPPTTWSEDDNLRWKLPLPGKGHSTPILWGDYLYLTTAEAVGEPVDPIHDHAHGSHNNLPITSHFAFRVLAVNRADGSIAWDRILHTTLPREGGHETGSLASHSPVTDGDRLFACFGSHGLYALDLAGELQWKQDLGPYQSYHAHGEGSSPALHGDTLVVNWDHEGDSFLHALDTRTGQPIWKMARNEGTSWSTPLIVDHEGGAQVIVAATQRIRGYDLATGELIWECAGLSRNVVASPVHADGLVIAANSYDRQAMIAIRLEGARGDITGTDQVVWTRDRQTPYVPSPLLVDHTLYFLHHLQGIFSAVDVRTGATVAGPQRLEGLHMIFSSPVGAADRLYFTDREGTTLVVRRGEGLEVIARNHLDDHFSASAAVGKKELYLRGEKYLYCIAEP